MKDHLTVTDVYEHAFCPKFTYFELVLGVPQHEERHGSVIRGRQIHRNREYRNPCYKPRETPKGTVHNEVLLHSKKYNFSGKIDRFIEREDSCILVEVKNSRPFLGKTVKVQIGLLAVLIEENFNKPCELALVRFLRGAHTKRWIEVTDELKGLALEELNATQEVIKSGLMPFSEYSKRCLDCCYRRNCPVAHLKRAQ